MSQAPSKFDTELADVEAHLENNRRIAETQRKLEYLKAVDASMDPHLKLFRPENIFRGLTVFMLGISIEGFFPHDVHPHFMPVAASLGMVVGFLCGYLLFEGLNRLAKNECLPIFVRKREIPELQPLYEKLVKERYLHPSRVRNEVRNIVQALEKEKETLEFEDVIFRQSKANPWN